jgi:G:T-mismatch repair DNA endonuclease (very short patch repair protein)
MDTRPQEIPTNEEFYKPVGEKWYTTRYPEFVKYLYNHFPENYEFKERLYSFLNNINERPKCVVCGNEVKFRNIAHGYNRCCCSACVGKDPQRQEKIDNAKIKKYGTAKYFNHEKFKQTCLEKYGVENPFAAESCKQTIKQTLLDRYGVEYAQQSKQIQETRKKNSLEKYGVDHHMKTDEIRLKVSKIQQQSNIEEKESLIGYTEDGHWICKCPHPECDKCVEKTYIIPTTNYYSRVEFDIEPCTNLHPLQWSRKEGTLLEKFIRDILDEYHIEYETNNRSVLKDRELDIYIPSKKLAIECNGCFWHSQQHHKPINYHVDKFKRCLQNNIQLITFWEDQIKTTPEIVKSVLLSKLNIYEYKVGARQCDIKEIDSRTCASFLEYNHIQGRTNSTIRLGLYKDNELVSVMAFYKKHDNIWELCRFCTKLHYHIHGAAGKLLNYFIKNYQPNTITSYSSNDISNGDLYKKLGFENDNKITSAYWYIHKTTLERLHRSNFSKAKLKNMGYDIEGKSESDIMSNLPYYKIYDSGHVKYTLNLNIL